MHNTSTESSLKFYRKDRVWLFLNAIVYSVFGFYAARELLFSIDKTPISYAASGVIFAVAVFASAVYWQSFNMYLIVQDGGVKVKGWWWQEIDIPLMSIEKCEFHSSNYPKKCILYLNKPMSKIFRFSSNLPLTVLEKNRAVVSLSSFLSEQDWLEFERIVCQH